MLFWPPLRAALDPGYGRPAERRATGAVSAGSQPLAPRQGPALERGQPSPMSHTIDVPPKLAASQYTALGVWITCLSDRPPGR